MTLAAQKPESSNHRSVSAISRRNPGPEDPSHLAHDARNWLTVLQMYCDLLRTSGVVAEEGEKWVQELSSALERGYGLVDSLLDSAQPGVPHSAQPGVPLARPASKKAASSAPFKLADAIERRLPLLRHMAGSRIQIDLKTAAQEGTVALQEPEFERILLNLTRNAIEAMPNGGKLKLALEYRHSSRSAAMVLRVSDTGHGISAEVLPHIFESGVSTKLVAEDAPQSRGFGLAIVRELTLGAGGSIRVRSRPGHGTALAIELPLLELPLLELPTLELPVLPDPCSSASRPRIRKSRKPGTVSEMPKRQRDH